MKFFKLHIIKFLFFNFLFISIFASYNTIFAVENTPVKQTSFIKSIGNSLTSISNTVEDGFISLFNSFKSTSKPTITTETTKIKTKPVVQEVPKKVAKIDSTIVSNQEDKAIPAVATSNFNEIKQAGLIGNVSNTIYTQGPMGPIGPQGPKGDTGASGTSIDTSSFVPRSFFDRQIDVVFNSINNNVSNTSKSITENGTLNNPTLNNATGTFVGILTGNADTVTNGVYTSRKINGYSLATDVTLTKSDVGLGNVTNESKTTMFTSPTFTGSVAGFTMGGNITLGANTLTTTNATLVSNLNSDLLDGQHGSYYAVASTSVPYTGGTTDLNLGIHNLTVDTNSLFVDSSTHKTGFGTLSPTYRIDAKGTAATDGIRSDMGFDIYQVPNPTAPTGIVSAGGNVDTGTHWYAVSYITALGETNLQYTSSQITTTSGNNMVILSIPVSTDPRVTGRKIYRTKAGSSNQFTEYLLATVANNTDTTYTDTASDTSLSGSSGVGFYRPNTTSNGISINGARSLTIDRNGTYFGSLSGSSLTTGGASAFFGTDSGRYTTTGISNTAFGHTSLRANTTGSQNTAVGASALFSSISSSYNTAVGYFSLVSATSGGNTSIGANSLSNLTTGQYNTAIGYAAGRYINGGSSNITSSNSLYLGYDTRALADGGSNEIVIGYNTVGKGSNTTTIGTGNVLYVGGSTVVGTVARFTSSTGYCDISPISASLVCSSDQRLKKNITTLDNKQFLLQTIPDTTNLSTLEKLSYLTPVNYNWNSELDTDSKHIGFIAQEMEKVFPSLVTTDTKAEPINGYFLKSISYTNLIPYTIEAIKEMNLKIKGIETLDINSTFISSLKNWLASATNGIDSIFAKIMKSDKVETKELCVGNTCVTEEQFLQLINKNNITATGSTTSNTQATEDSTTDSQTTDSNKDTQADTTENSEVTEDSTTKDTQSDTNKDSQSTEDSTTSDSQSGANEDSQTTEGSADTQATTPESAE